MCIIYLLRNQCGCVRKDTTTYECAQFLVYRRCRMVGFHPNILPLPGRCRACRTKEIAKRTTRHDPTTVSSLDTLMQEVQAQPVTASSTEEAKHHRRISSYKDLIPENWTIKVQAPPPPPPERRILRVRAPLPQWKFPTRGPPKGRRGTDNEDDDDYDPDDPDPRPLGPYGPRPLPTPPVRKQTDNNGNGQASSADVEERRMAVPRRRSRGYSGSREELMQPTPSTTQSSSSSGSGLGFSLPESTPPTSFAFNSYDLDTEPSTPYVSPHSSNTYVPDLGPDSEPAQEPEQQVAQDDRPSRYYNTVHRGSGLKGTPTIGNESTSSARGMTYRGTETTAFRHRRNGTATGPEAFQTPTSTSSTEQGMENASPTSTDADYTRYNRSRPKNTGSSQGSYRGTETTVFKHRRNGTVIGPETFRSPTSGSIEQGMDNARTPSPDQEEYMRYDRSRIPNTRSSQGSTYRGTETTAFRHRRNGTIVGANTFPPRTPPTSSSTTDTENASTSPTSPMSEHVEYIEHDTTTWFERREGGEAPRAEGSKVKQDEEDDGLIDMGP